MWQQTIKSIWNHLKSWENKRFIYVLGWGTDEKAIISILGHRNATQRKLIRLAYEEIYNEDLINQLKSELSGDFEVSNVLFPFSS